MLYAVGVVADCLERHAEHGTAFVEKAEVALGVFGVKEHGVTGAVRMDFFSAEENPRGAPEVRQTVGVCRIVGLSEKLRSDIDSIRNFIRIDGRD